PAMRFSALLDKPFFSSRFKLHIHLLQVLLVSLALGLCIPRLFVKNAARTRSRSSTITLSMAAKSLLLLTYTLASSHVPRFRPWHSYKAHMIIAAVEVASWSAVAGLIVQGNCTLCTGTTCLLSWIVVGIAVVVAQIGIWCFAVSVREFCEDKAGGGSHAQRYRASSRDEAEMRDLGKSGVVVGGRG
ncbi:hypothetical protein J1614_012053, partial [Plenodomus biglobosus]